MSELLYNGIQLPSDWPPQDQSPQSDEPMRVPYLDKPPDIIPIDVGRQLFVDDFLIETTDLARVCHKPNRYRGNPVLSAATFYETRIKRRVGLQQGGVFYHPEKMRFEMFYHSGTLDPRRRHLAFSQDMIHWERPDFGQGCGNHFREPGPDGEALSPDSPGSVFAVWLDLEADCPNERYKLLGYNRGDPHMHLLHTSPDGVNWSSPIPAGPAGDAQSMFYNPFRKVWVFSIKRSVMRRGQSLRARWYVESPDFLKGNDWREAVYWTCADLLDAPEPSESYPAYPAPGESCQLYALHGVAYESILLGMHEIHRGPENPLCREGGFPKLTDLELGYSRDGFHWSRPDRSGFIRGMRNEGHWDRAYLHSTTSVLLVHEDRLIFPYSGYSGRDVADGPPEIYGGGAIGIATLRRDGFVSMRADGERILVTRPVKFTGGHLFVNVDNPNGALLVEALDAHGSPLPGFTRNDCVPVRADNTKCPVHWRSGVDIGRFASQPVRFRFHLTQGDLYAFWVSRSPKGESGGYVAGGGPSFSGIRDECSGG